MEPDHIARHLASHTFRELFIEVLGWDRAPNTEENLEVRKRALRFQLVVQKRGLAVLLCEAHRTVLANRQLLRLASLALSKKYHEHIAIYASTQPQKQVWVWSTHQAGGTKLIYREHPFFSERPPPKFLRRIAELEIPMASEESLTLADVLRKSRMTLDHDAEEKLFAKYGWMAEAWDALAVRVKRGDMKAFDEFVATHDRLCIHYAKKISRWFRIEYDDAMQMARFGLLEAARRYDPERGYQFSTYACHWIRQRSERMGKRDYLRVHVPDYLFWPCFYLERAYWRWATEEGKDRANDKLYDILQERELASLWPYFKRATGIKRFSDLSNAEEQEVRTVAAKQVNPTVDLQHAEQASRIREVLDRLKPRERSIILRRFGFDGNEETLEEIAATMGVTRERIRQIEKKALDRLQYLFKKAKHDRQNVSPMQSLLIMLNTKAKRGGSNKAAGKPQSRLK